jgi:flagellin
MRINNNIMALNAHRQLAVNQSNAAKSMERLSSGMRINRAGDDAAGLAISEKMRGQIRGLKQASRNAQDGISLIQTAEGALTETHAILQRMRELAVQASSDTNVDELDREAIQNEFNQLKDEIDTIRNNTEFNTQKLLNGGGEGLTATVTGAGKITFGPADPVEEVLGKYTFKFTAATEAGGTVTIDGEEVTLAEDTDAEGLAALINDHTTLGARFEASAEGDVVTLTERPGEATGQDLASGDVTVSGGGNAAIENFAVAVSSVAASAGGELALTITKPFEEGDTLEVGGVTYTFVTGTADATNNEISLDAIGTTETAQATGLATVLGAQDGIASATAEGSSVIIVPEDVAGGTFKATFQIGANETQIMSIEIGDMGAEALGLNNVDLSSGETARQAITTINSAINDVSNQRSALGAYQNRLEHTISNLNNSAENLQAAESRIRDLDMAEEIMAFTKNNILQQAATAMLAQANMAPQSVLQLLG